MAHRTDFLNLYLAKGVTSILIEIVLISGEKPKNNKLFLNV